MLVNMIETIQKYKQAIESVMEKIIYIQEEVFKETKVEVKYYPCFY